MDSIGLIFTSPPFPGGVERKKPFFHEESSLIESKDLPNINKKACVKAPSALLSYLKNWISIEVGRAQPTAKPHNSSAKKGFREYILMCFYHTCLC